MSKILCPFCGIDNLLIEHHKDDCYLKLATKILSVTEKSPSYEEMEKAYRRRTDPVKDEMVRVLELQVKHDMGIQRLTGEGPIKIQIDILEKHYGKPIQEIINE